jgi:hypothetical protein
MQWSFALWWSWRWWRETFPLEIKYGDDEDVNDNPWLWNAVVTPISFDRKNDDDGTQWWLQSFVG